MSSGSLDRQLELSIERERQQMVNLADQIGLQHKEVLAVSQGLDKLVNDYFKLPR